MSQYTVLLHDYTTFILLVPFQQVTGKELLRRLSLKNEWKYILSCKSKNSSIIFIHPNEPNDIINNKNSLIPSNSTIRLFKKATEPIINYNLDVVEKIKRKYVYLKDVNYILIWINYNLFYKPSEPYYLTFIYKKDNLWFEDFKTSTADDFNDVISNNLNLNIFDIPEYVLDRYDELYSMYG